MARKPSRADMVRIRLVLRGCTNRPFFNIVVTHANRPFNTGKLLDHVGSYDPMPNHRNEQLVGLNIDRIKYWIGQGAEPTLGVYKLLSLHGLIPMHPRLLLEAKRNREAAASTSGSAATSTGSAVDIEQLGDDVDLASDDIQPPSDDIDVNMEPKPDPPIA